jgi:hypothetical protein
VDGRFRTAVLLWGEVEGVVGDMVESARVDVIPLQTGNLACDRFCKASWEFVLGSETHDRNVAKEAR